MATKLLTMSELRTATYGTFSRSGVRVDIGGYFKTQAGRKAIDEIRAGVPISRGTMPIAMKYRTQ